jgi:hypothetical protein
MAVFGVIKTEELVQTFDKTRISCIDTYKTPGEQDYFKIEIEPETGAGFFDVTGSLNSPEFQKNWYLDWQYSAPGNKVVTLRVTTTDGSLPVPTLTNYNFTKTLSVISEAEDKLFSTDEMLTSVVSDILRWIPEGRNSFKREHREAQRRILAWLDENGFKDTSGNKLTKDSVVDISEVREWSKYLTLMIIYDGLSNAIDDVFQQQARRFEALATTARNRKYLRLDYTGDGTISTGEKYAQTTVKLVRS